MNPLPGPSLLVALCLLTSSSAAVASIDSTLETSGSLSADIRRILESPETPEMVESDGMTGSLDPSLDYYYSRLGTSGSVDVLGDRHGVAARPRRGEDSTTTKKKDPKQGEISEPHAAWLLVAGALGLIAFGRRSRSRNLKRSPPDA